jgi:mRNA interferase RelE/StbE
MLPRSHLIRCSVSSVSKTDYTVEVSNPAKKDLKGLSREAQIRVAASLKALLREPRPSGVKKLKGCDSYRIRCGDYRIVYDIDDNARAVRVLIVRHRSAAYRK